ncbi:Fatty-acid amide hydrolase 1 [Channa argus]|uniref:Fatty-acid amide hydrolase 1 n=1 Tax=Channa argus TaxID=215402 RepID=A0A6G1PL94_CHAAH|nr:Fatty-acid amide hydrolase 1 [Channa argus]
MENVKELIRGVELDRRAAALLTGAACGVGALVVFIGKVNSHQAAMEKIQRARNRRTEGLQRAEQAVLRYKESTLETNKKLNCCTGILLESLDQLKTVSSNIEGLLYGVPVSIKENFAYKPAEKDSVLVEVLKSQGAIPFVKTNIPQGLLSYDCSNPIYGQTVNPHNHQKTSGGSSGGEGALIGGGGSLLGIGSDIGGSIRIPASFCGICGFKPTPGRLSLRGMSSIYRGQKSVLSSPGPMARDVDSLALCMQALLCEHMFYLDPTVPPMPFNQQIYHSSKPLRIGYLVDDGYTQPTPSMARGIREVKALLEQAGHTLVPYSPPKINYVMHELLVRGVLGDGGTNLLQKLKGGPVDSCLKGQVFPYSLPVWLKKTISFLLKPLFPRVSSLFSALCGVGSVPELWQQHADVEDYIHETVAYWRSCNIDVLLSPVIGPAFNFTYCGKITTVLNYTMIYNLLTFPAGVVPVSTVTAKDDEEVKHYKGNYQDHWDKLIKRAVSGGKGLPVAVQCVALPWQDELCLRFMKEVEQLVKQSRKDQGAHSLYGCTEFQVVMFDAAGSCLLDDQSDKFSLRPEPLTGDIKKQQDWQLLDLCSISSAITTSRGDML